MILKVNDLLKDVQQDYVSFSKLVDNVVSSIGETIYEIPDGFKVSSFYQFRLLWKFESFELL